MFFSGRLLALSLKARAMLCSYFAFHQSSVHFPKQLEYRKPQGHTNEKNIFFLFLNLNLLLNLSSCNTTESQIIPPPPPDLRKITLVFEDASCTEVWLKIKADSITLPAEINLLQDARARRFTLTNKDTVIYIDSILPNQTYNYQSALSTDTTIKSEKVTAQTLEPTSHNFTWQTWEFGEHSSSTLYDVAIIDESNIWAVGEIYMNDSLGNPDPIAYNAVHWDGNQWTLQRIYYYGACSAVDYPPLKAILTFSVNNIVVTNGGSIGWFDGNAINLDCRVNPLLTGAINKLWGTSSINMYVVGNNGNIAHYNGSTWTEIESGTTLHLTDIYGDTKGNIYSAGVDIPSIKGVVVKSNTTNQWDVMIEGEVIDESQLITKLFGSFGAIWVDEIGTIYTCGDFLYQFKNNKWNFVNSLLENYIGGNQFYIGYLYSIRGNKSNDIIIAGDRNTLRHFNGLDWVAI